MGFKAIAAGAYHSLGLKQDGYLVVPWGNNYDSQCDVPSNLLKIPIIERYSYDVFGKPTIQDANGVVLTASAFGNPYMFTGRYYDTETGNYYYRARMYSPKLGRFLQTDPIGYRGGINLYTYCGNNSLNFTDPYGLVGLNDSPLISTDPELASKNFEFYTAGGSGKTSSLSEYIDEVCTLPWNIGEEAKRIEKEEFPGYADPFGGDYRHFLAGGMAARNCGLAGGAIGILWMGDSHEVYWKRETNVGSDMRYDAEAEWRGYREALMHPFTSLRELGKYNTVRPIGSKIIKQGN
jgi:RHS repeat-associated protein